MVKATNWCAHFDKIRCLLFFFLSTLHSTALMPSNVSPIYPTTHTNPMLSVLHVNVKLKKAISSRMLPVCTEANIIAVISAQCSLHKRIFCSSCNLDIIQLSGAHTQQTAARNTISALEHGITVSC